MTNSFTDYAFSTNDVGAAARTLPDRLTDYHNAKDFGALGDGTGALLNTRYASLGAAQVDYPFVTDIDTQTIDWAGIMGAFNWTATTNKETVYIPPGTYVVSDPIDISSDVAGVLIHLTGSFGATTIIGDFNDYVIKKLHFPTGAAGPSFVDNLIIINNHATGGGIRLGGSVGAALRFCNITANRGINQQGDDSVDGGATSLEFTTTNCQLNPGTNTSGSIGMVTVANGAISNCQITGYEKGVITWGQQGGHVFQGCYFEGNEIAIRTGLKPDGSDFFDSGSSVVGCWFKNNGTAIYLSHDGGQNDIRATRIDADENVTVYGSRPQYGIRMVNAPVANLSGVLVTGQYEQAAIVVDSEGTSDYTAVNAFNTSNFGGVAWDTAGANGISNYVGSNSPVTVFGLADLGTLFTQVNSGTWDSGTGLTTMTMFGNMGPYNGKHIQVTFTGLSPSGFNGTYICTTTSGNDLIYAQSNPGGTTTTGNPFAVLNINLAVKEGQTFNVDDSTSLTWGDTPISGGSTHAKVRWGVDGTNWTVVGK